MTGILTTKRARALLLVYLVCVLGLCLWHFQQMPSDPMFFLGIPADKYAHFLMFLPFPVLCRLSLDFKDGKKRRRVISAVTVLAAGCIFAAATEYLQGLLPYRTAEKWDFLADVFGMALSTAIILVHDLRTENEK